MTPERLLSIILVIGFLGAPLIALLYGPTTGLFVLAGALGVTISLAWSARSTLPAHVQPKLRVLLALNGVLLVVTLVALVLVSL